MFNPIRPTDSRLTASLVIGHLAAGLKTILLFYCNDTPAGMTAKVSTNQAMVLVKDDGAARHSYNNNLAFHD